MRDPSTSTARFTSVVSLATFVMLLAACGGGGEGGSDPAPTPDVIPAADPLHTVCNSTVPLDSGEANHPVIFLTGPRVIHHPLGTNYVDAGARAVTLDEGDISSKIQVIGLATLDTNVVGDYLIRYNVENLHHVPALTRTRLVRVSAGTFASLTARDIGTTRGYMGYYEHLPVNYGDDPEQTFPLLVFWHGWGNARFLNDHAVQAPLSILEQGNLVKLIKDGLWDNSRPFIVLSPQKCEDATIWGGTSAAAKKRFVDYAINTYKIDARRIYMAGHSQGSADTWDYAFSYPDELAATVTLAAGYAGSSGCVLKSTPVWAFNGEGDGHEQQVLTVNSINDCSPVERAKVTVLPGIGHNDVQAAVFGLTGLGQGLSQYDLYDQNIYDWLLEHRLP